MFAVIVLNTFDIGGTTPLSSTIAASGIRVRVTRVTSAVWNSMTPADFAEYAAVIIPDTQRISGQAACSPSSFDVFRGQGGGWMGAIDGNIVVTATNEFFSSNFNGGAGSKVARHFAAHALALPNTTGAYISLSNCFSSVGPVNVGFLEEAFGGSMIVQGVPSTGVVVGTNNVCSGTSIVPQLVGTGAGLDLPTLPTLQSPLVANDFITGWSGCTATAVFTVFGSSRLRPYVVEQGTGPYISPLGGSVQGHPFVLTTADELTLAPTTAQPTAFPTSPAPSELPTRAPTAVPSRSPTSQPSPVPTIAPSAVPTLEPTHPPTGTPSERPSALPTAAPTFAPTAAPTGSPIAQPTAHPTFSPSARPTSRPTNTPSSSPTPSPTGIPTRAPTEFPTAQPTTSPTISPTAGPTTVPTAVPTDTPTTEPTSVPTMQPTPRPTDVPTTNPTASPTREPTISPSLNPTAHPTAKPSLQPSARPTTLPTTATTQTTTTTATTVTTSNSCFQGCMATCPITNAPVTLTSRPTSAPSTAAPTPFSSTLHCAEIPMDVNAFTNVVCPTSSVIDEIVYIGLGNPIGFCVNGRVRSEFTDGTCNAPPSFGAYDGCIGQNECLILSGSAAVVLPLHSGGFSAEAIQRGCTYGTHTRLKLTYRCRTVSPAPTSVPTALCEEGWGLPATFRSTSSASSPHVAYQYYFSGWANSTIYLLTRTESPTPAPTRLDCGRFVCSQDCSGPCGWSSGKQLCMPGARTTAREHAARLRAGGGTCAASTQINPALSNSTTSVNRSAIAAADSDRRTWDDAEATCARMGGHLASVHSLEEYNYIASLEGLAQQGGATATSDGHCTVTNGSSLVGWVDSEGFSCLDYEFEGWCNAYGGEGSAWNRTAWGGIETFGVGGYSALDACVVCGCNRRKTAWIGASRARVDDRNTHPFTFTFSDGSGSSAGLEFAFVVNEVQAAPCIPLSVFGRPSSECLTIWAGSGRGALAATSEPRDLPCTATNFSNGRPCNGIETCVSVGGEFEDPAGRWEDADCLDQRLYVCKREWPAFCQPTTTTTTTATQTTTTASTVTTASTTTATTFDCFTHCRRQCVGWQGYTNCSQIRCSTCCDDNVLFGCGWQSFTDTCVEGAVSRPEETGARGDCTGVRTPADCVPPTPPPPAATLLTAATCHLMNQCGRCCNSSNGACGWSRRSGVCKPGGVTRTSELNLGTGCDQPCPDFRFFTSAPTLPVTTTTTAPVPQTSAPTTAAPIQGISTCGEITCARCCSGICGWSSATQTCILGEVTRPDELAFGSCTVLNCVDLPLTDAFRALTGLTRPPTSAPTPPAPTTAPTPFQLRADECHFGSTCGRCCTGPICGWSKKNGGECRAGARTTNSELASGRDCSSACQLPPRAP